MALSTLMDACEGRRQKDGKFLANDIDLYAQFTSRSNSASKHGRPQQCLLGGGGGGIASPK